MRSDIVEILGEIRPEFDFSKSEDFFEDGMLDSFDIVLLVAQLDESFGISILGTEVVPENFRNLKAIERLISCHSVKT